MRQLLHLGDDVREIDFLLGGVVYHRCRDEPVRGMVTGYSITFQEVLYWVTWGNSVAESRHYAVELTSDRPVLDGSGAD